MTTRNRKCPGSPGRSKYERAFGRAKSWAERQPPEELAVHFAGLLTTCLIEREIHRHRQGAAEKAAIDATVREIVRDVEYKLERKRSARGRWANDPTQQAKAMALELWKERHQGKHPRLRRVADFAAEVMRRAPVLTNAKTIEGWSAKWTKQARNGENPTC